MGLPGAGKGTQAAMVSKKYNLLHFETSRLIREKFNQGLDDPDVAKAKEAYDKGDLISAQLLFKWQVEKINNTKIENGIVFDGSPRTLYEAQNLVPFLKKEFGDDSILVIDIYIDAEDTIWRNTHRKICQACGKPIPFLPETENLRECPVCGSKLVTRKLDKLEIIRERIAAYQRDTQPAMDYLVNHNLLTKVDGKQSMEKVSRAIMDVIDNHFK